MSEETRSKEQIVIDMVKEGVHTREDILKVSEATPGSFASYLTAMRNAAKYTGAEYCPVEVEVEGRKVFQVTTYENMLATKPEPKIRKPSTPKTFAERLVATEKRVKRAMEANEKAQAKFIEVGTRVAELQALITNAEVELAQIALTHLQAEMQANGAEVDADADADVDADADRGAEGRLERGADPRLDIHPGRHGQDSAAARPMIRRRGVLAVPNSWSALSRLVRA